MSENPYAASLVEHEHIAPPVPPLPQEATAREVFVAWEKLRLLFNGIVAALGLLGGATGVEAPAWVIIAIGYNIVFCVGPVCEGYFAILGLARRPSRLFLFCIGTIAACLLTLARISAS